MNKKITIFFFLATFRLILLAQNPEDLSFRFVETQIGTQPTSLRFQWLPLSSISSQIKIFRKLSTDQAYTQLATLNGSETSYVDGTITEGLTYDYSFESYKTNGLVFARTFVYGGIKKPQTIFRGKIILLVDDTFSTLLEGEISRLCSDIEGDGWRVIKYNVSRSSSHQTIKSLIVNEYNNDPTNVKSVFILGHLAVPYSGNINPDAHTDHQGAWPCDGYYADMIGNWTDTQVNNSTASDSRNRNIPGDGKFDQSTFSNELTLEVGRVDFYDMPEFSKTEVELMQQYLNKNHNYRHGITQIEQKAIIDDNLGYFGGETLATCGWRAFSPMFANNKIVVDDYRTLTRENKQGYLWAYGCGFGDYSSVGNVSHTMYLASEPHGAVFNMFFGSYLGDWDTRNNIMRAVLASQGSGLTCFWAGRPFGIMHHMALGETIGTAMKVTMGNFFKYQTNNYAHLFYRMVHVSLMGDPTLRMHVVLPPSNVILTGSNGAYELNWTKSEDSSVEGYNVYRHDPVSNTYVKLNNSVIVDNHFSDLNVYSTAPQYLVKAIKTELTNSGSYVNQSQGVKAVSSTLTQINFTSNSEISVFPNPVNKLSELIISQAAELQDAHIEIFDIAGHVVYSNKTTDKITKIIIPGNLASGIYKLKLTTSNRVYNRDIIIK